MTDGARGFPRAPLYFGGPTGPAEPAALQHN